MFQEKLIMDKIMELLMDIIQQMIESGAEISRVEESINRMCRAYGCEPHVYATAASVTLTVRRKDGFHGAYSRRILKSSIDVERLHCLNNLVRHITATTPGEEEISAELQKIQAVPRYTNWFQIVSYSLIAGCFCIFFGGRDLWEILASFIIGALIGVTCFALDKLGCNKILNRFVCSFLSATAALFLFRVHVIPTADNIIIGNIMSLIPGVGLTNSLKDLFTGDTITGILRLMEAILLALAMALGYWAALFVVGGAV